MPRIMFDTAIGADCGPASPPEEDDPTWLEATLGVDEAAEGPMTEQRPVKPGHIFAGLAVAIVIFGTMVALLALSAGALMQRPHNITAQTAGQHAAAEMSTCIQSTFA